MMKRLVLLGTVLMGVMLLSIPLLHAEVLDGSASVGASASVAVSTGLVVTEETGTNGIIFSNITETYQVADATEYIRVEAYSNYGGWNVEIYTNNFSTYTYPISTTTWGYAYGGLVDKSRETKIPLGWCAFDEIIDGCDSAGDPSASHYDVTYGTIASNRWTWVKDKYDVDDPTTTIKWVDGVETGNEQWTSRGGYCNIAWGVPGESHVVNPMNPGAEIPCTDDMTNNDLYLYLETAALPVPGNFSSTIWFDLYHE